MNALAEQIALGLSAGGLYALLALGLTRLPGRQRTLVAAPRGNATAIKRSAQARAQSSP